MSRKKLKNSVSAVPVIGYSARVVSNTVRLPKLHDQLMQQQERTNNLLLTLQKVTEKLSGQAAKLAQDIKDIQMAQDGLQGQFSLLETSRHAQASANVPQKSADKELFADDHIMDTFYTAHEDRFRGSEAMILERLEVYLPYFSNSKVNFDKKPVLDIGSGRGEFLQLL